MGGSKVVGSNPTRGTSQTGKRVSRYRKEGLGFALVTKSLPP